MTAYRAWIPDRDEGPDEGFDVPGLPDDARYAAERAAEHCHYRRGGLDWDWPVTIAIRDPRGRVDYFEVQREAVPEFTAQAVREQPGRREQRR